MGIHDGHRDVVRQRFLKGGLDSFADHEALELLLFYAIPRRDTNETAHLLMERYGSLSAVLAAPIEDLKKVAGIGESAAILLKLVPQLSRKARLQEAGKEKILNSSEAAGAFLLECFEGEGTPEEVAACERSYTGQYLKKVLVPEKGAEGSGLKIRNSEIIHHL